MVKVILGFGNGNVEKGCEHITVKVRSDDDRLIAQDNGSLPPSPQLWKLYNSWKSSFRRRFGGRIILSKKPGSSSSQLEMELNQYTDKFPKEFNKWLLKDGFRPIEKLLRDYLNFDIPVNFTVEAEDNQLRRLPWYLWKFFEDYPNAEPAVAFTKYAGGRIGKSKRNNVRILVVIGNSQGINTEEDKKIIQESLGDAKIEILPQPSRQELDDCLWDERGWDILVFLGHSGSSEDGSTGKIQINENDSLSLTDLKHALSSAIKKGLQLAIFNSCNGLGLVQDLRDLYLPHCIVMRESVPDKIAQEFIKSFLPAFKDGKSLSMAIQEAREKLQKWENNYPCATWLPVLCQNPAVESINWVHLGGKPACPYRGLFAFQEEDADIFFGREAVSEELYQRVESRQTLVAVVGASGSGKSSVVFAGLIPRLRNTGVEIVDFRPGKNPFESLAVALAPKWYAANHPGCDFENLTSDECRYNELDLLTKLKDKRGLCEVIETIVAPSSRRLVIVADQFEELYTLLPQSEENTCELFLDSLLNAINDSPAFNLVLTLRADFLHHAIKDHKFAKELKDKNYILAPMNREELQQAIRIPPEKRGVKLEPGLLELLLDDVGEKAENLPLLEFALTQLWTKQEYGLLTRNSYQEIGGLQQSLARHAEDIYTQLNAEQRQRMKRVFIQLVRPGEGAADTRNVVYKSELQDKDWDLITFLNQENVRLVVINYDKNRRETVEIVHEALISGWGRLSTWMKYHREFRTWQERLKVGMKNWEEKHRDDGYLLTGGTLGEAEDWFNSEEHFCYLSDAQRGFIQSSLDARDRKIKKDKRKQKRTILGFAGFSIVSLVFAGFAGFNWMYAEKNSTESKINSFRVNSEYLFGSQQYEDALIEGIKGNELLENSWFKHWIPTKLQHKVKVALHNAIYDSIALEKKTLWANDFISLKFSPNGKIIADDRDDKTVKLWSASDGRLLHTLYGVNSYVEFSPDSKTIAFGSDFNTVKLWSEENGKLLHTLSGHKDKVYSIEFSPDNKTIASSSLDKTVKLWSAEKGKLLHTLSTGKTDDVEFSPDGKIIASTSYDNYDNTVKLWSIDGKLLHTLKGHKDNKVKFSPDGKIIALTSENNTVNLWSADNNKLLHTLKGHKSKINSVEFSPDGKTIALTPEDNTVKLWSVGNGKLLHTLSGHKDSVNKVKFSPDGKIIASASSDNTVRLWSASDGKLLHTLEGQHTSDVWNIKFSPDSKTIVSEKKLEPRDEYGKLEFWSVNNGELLHASSVGKFDEVKFSPNSKIVVYINNNGTVELLSTSDGKSLYTLEGHTSEVKSVKFSPDGKNFASISYDGIAKLWFIDDSKLLHTLDGSNIEFSLPDGKTIASTSRGTIKLWSTSNGELLNTLRSEYLSEHNRFYSVEFSPNGNIIASALSYGSIKLWSGSNGNKLLHTLENSYSRAGSDFELSPNGKFIASTSYDNYDNTVKLWSTSDGKLLHTLEGRYNWILNLEFSPDSNTIASSSLDGEVTLWSVSNGKLLHTLDKHESYVSSIKFSPDGNTIATASDDDGLEHKDTTVKLWSASDGKLLHTLSGHKSGISDVEFSPDGKNFASSGDNTVKLWSTSDGKLLYTLKGHQDEVNSVDFSLDGKTIASSSLDKTVKLWSASDGKLLHTLRHQDKVGSVEFSPDGNTIASESYDGTVKLWDWNFDNLSTRGCDKLQGYLIEHPEKLEELKVCQNPQTLTAAAYTLFQQSEEFVINSDFENADFAGALAKFQKAKKWNPKLDINQLKIPAYKWARLCWNGSLYNHAKDVMFACEKAVALTPKNGNYRDSRGLARALTGDYKGAIEDFEVYVNWTNNLKQKSKSQRHLKQRHLKQKSQRQSWIKDLRNGKNPFTPEVLEELRN